VAPHAPAPRPAAQPPLPGIAARLDAVEAGYVRGEREAVAKAAAERAARLERPPPPPLTDLTESDDEAESEEQETAAAVAASEAGRSPAAAAPEAQPALAANLFRPLSPAALADGAPALPLCDQPGAGELAESCEPPSRAPPLPDSFQVQLRSLDGVVTADDMTESDTVAVLCSKLSAKLGRPCLALVYQSKLLHDNFTLGDYLIRPGALPAGCGAGSESSHAAPLAPACVGAEETNHRRVNTASSRAALPQTPRWSRRRGSSAA